jgi:hypothetical protein
MTLRISLLALACVAATATAFAPAPVYKERPSLESAHRARPKALRDRIERTQTTFRDRLESYREQARRAGNLEGDARWPLEAEWLKEAQYIYPVYYLASQSRQPIYQNRDDQRKIEEALKLYRLRYYEAKRKGLFGEPRGMAPLK